MSRLSLRVGVGAILLVLAWVSTAQAGERKVLVARPAVAKSLSELTLKSIKDGMYRGLTASKAYAVDEGDIGGEMKKLGVASLSGRIDSHKVAKGIGAYAVLRYLAKRQGAQTKVRVILVLTEGDRLLFLDRVAANDEQLESVVQQMVVDLMAGRVGGAAASQPATTTTTPPTPPTGTPPTGTPPTGTPPTGTPPTGTPPTGTPPVETPSGPSIFSVPNPLARSGFVAEGHVGVSMPLGTSSDAIGPGVRGGVHLGWQLDLGNFLSWTPALMVSIVRWGFKDAALDYLRQQGFNVDSGAVLMLDVLAGARFTAHFARFSAWSGLYLGFGWWQTSVSGGGQSSSDSLSGFALAWELGFHYMFLRNLGAGFFLDVTKSFVGKLPGNTESPTAAGFGLGLSIRSLF